MTKVTITAGETIIIEVGTEQTPVTGATCYVVLVDEKTKEVKVSKKNVFDNPVGIVTIESNDTWDLEGIYTMEITTIFANGITLIEKVLVEIQKRFLTDKW